METYAEFSELFLAKAAGSDIRFLIQDLNFKAFCVGIRFELVQDQIEPYVRFFCTKDASDSLQLDATNILSLGSVSVIPPHLYYAAGLLYKRVASWMRGEVNLQSVPFNTVEYKTLVLYKDHRGD